MDTQIVVIFDAELDITQKEDSQKTLITKGGKIVLNIIQLLFFSDQKTVIFHE